VVHPDRAEASRPGDDARVDGTVTGRDAAPRAGLPGERSLSREALWYAVGSIAGKAVGLLTLPIYARLLGPAEFGRLDVLNALVSAGLMTMLLGMDVAVTRLYFDRQPMARRHLFGSWFLLGFAIVTPVCVGLIVGAPVVSRMLFGSNAQESAVTLVGIVLLVGEAHLMILGVLRTTRRAQTYALLEGGALVANAFLSVALLVTWRADTVAVMAALAASWAAAAAVGVVAVWRETIGRPTRADASALLRLGLPLAPAVAAACMADLFNRAFLLGAAGAEQAGYLSIAIRVSSIAGLLVAAIQLAWQPHAYRMGSSGHALVRLGAEARTIVIVLALLVAGLLAVLPDLVAVIGGGRYQDAGPASSIYIV
jgi:O-antigen/teichoic acid export membrane protein